MTTKTWTTLLLTLTSIYTIAQPIAFREDFNDNHNNWMTTFSGGTCAVADGRYTIDKTSETGNYFMYISNFLETGREFVVETTMRQVSGIDNHGYGLIWGSNETRDSWVYLITTNGYFTIFKYVNSKYEDFKPWTKIDGVNPMGTDNHLKIHHRLDSTIFFLNGKQLFRSLSLRPRGFYTGFTVNNRMKVDIDYLEIRQMQESRKEVEGIQNGLVKENLGSGVNSTLGEVLPIISADGRTLYFDRKLDNEPYDEIFVSQLQSDNQWGEAINAGFPLNNSGYNFVISVTPDGNQLLLGNTYRSDGQPDGGGISTSYRTASGWSVPTALKIDDYYNRNAYNEYALSPDGKTMVLCIERDDTWGAKDLYVSFLKEDGSWTAPANMGPVVNTMMGEVSPFIAADGKTIYYSTDGKRGYGNNDIYLTRRLDDTWLNWSEPLNLGPTVNTSAWEAYYTVPAKGDFAYLVSNEGTSTDIFRLKLADAAKPQPVVMVSGQVFDSKTKKTLSSSIAYESLVTGKELGVARTNPVDGSYQIALVSGDDYGFLAEAPGYYPVSENLLLKDLKEYREIKRDLYLVPIEINQTIRLNNLFFDFAKHDLKTESFAELNRLVDFMSGNPSIQILLTGHTDNVGDDPSNLRLSDERVNEVKKYLISKGIAASRLQAKGMGETMPVADNKTEDGRQLNRRVEFVITTR